LAYNRSTFPEQIDVLQEFFDVPPAQKTNVQRYQVLKMQSSLSSDEQIELNNLTTILQDYLITPEYINKFSDIVIGLETFFTSEVQGFITTKQGEMEDYVDNQTSAFDATLEKFSNKGAYSAVVTYQNWNTVTNGGETFLSLQDNNINHTPVGGVEDTWWQKMAVKGSQGIQGISGLNLIYRGTYDALYTYAIADATNWGGSIYYCHTQPPMGTAPSNNTYWSVFMQRSPIQVSATPPATPSLDDVYINSTNLIFYRYNGSTWVALRSDTITDGTYTFTASDINTMQTNIETISNEITVLNGAGEIVEKANKSALDTTNTNVTNLSNTVAEHQAETMPHQTTDGATTYKWGIACQSGSWGILYEEVVD